MKADIKEKMLKQAEEQSKTKLEESLIEKVAEASEVELPEVLVDRQIDRMMGDMENYLRQQGLGMDQFLELSGKTRQEMREENRPEAERRTKANLVLDAIAKKEGIIVDDSEVDKRIAEIAESYNDQPERIKDILEKQGRLPAIKEEMRIRKAVDIIVENANITMVKKEQEFPQEGEQEKEPEDKEEPKQAFHPEEGKTEESNGEAEEEKESKDE